MTNVSPFRRRRAGRPDLPAGRGGEMVVITVTSPERGAGRTMLAAHIAVQAEATGDGPVGLLDSDPKGDLFRWWTRRNGKMDSPSSGAHADPARVTVTLEAIAATGARLCVIDTAAGNPEAIAPIADHTDIFVIPADAGRDSAEPAAAFGHVLSGEAKVAYVINCRTHAGIEAGNALSAMSSGGWPAGTIEHANGFAIAMTAGRTVTESHAGTNAARDIVELWDNLRGILVAG